MLKRIVFLSLCTASILLMVASQGSSLKCYQCNSYYNETCGSLTDENKASFLLPCQKDEILCRTAYHSFQGTKRVIRSCGRTESKRPCYAGAVTQDIKSLTCECKKDACNTARKIESDILKLISVILVSLFLLR